MIISNQYQLLRQQLETLYAAGEAATIANWVLEYYTGMSRMAIKIHGEKKLSHHEKQSIKKALTELLNYRPVQYVLGEAWFKGMAFYVDEHVLIPRPETEELVDWAITIAHNLAVNISILEVGTGSGCIAVTMKKAFPLSKVIAIDISDEVLNVAGKNAKKMDAVIQFEQLDFLATEAWDKLGKFNLIISNPPYIPAAEKEKLDKHVTKWEPATALFVPDNDPLLFYRKITAFGKTHLEKNGFIFVECHQNHAIATKALFELEGYKAELKKDIFDNDRMIKASFT